MSRFQVRQEETAATARDRFAVIDTENKKLPVAHFGDRDDAQAHADKLNEGPLDWDEQEQWKDDWDDDDWGDSNGND